MPDSILDKIIFWTQLSLFGLFVSSLTIGIILLAKRKIK